MIEKISSISGKEEFIEYLQDLATDYTDNRDEWENIRGKYEINCCPCVGNPESTVRVSILLLA